MKRLQRAAWLVTGCYAAFHFVMTHLPPGNMPAVRVSDKTLHFLSYGLLTGCFYLAVWARGVHPRRTALIVMSGVAGFAGLDEVLQGPVGRSPEIADWVADVGAACVAVGSLWLLRLVYARRDRVIFRDNARGGSKPVMTDSASVE